MAAPCIIHASPLPRIVPTASPRRPPDAASLAQVVQFNPDFVISSLNVHRLLITSIMLASKFFDDVYYNNAYYARVGGISNSEVRCKPRANACETLAVFSPSLPPRARPLAVAFIRLSSTEPPLQNPAPGSHLATCRSPALSPPAHALPSSQRTPPPPPQVNSLEMEMLRMISFSLFVQPEQYERYRGSLYSHVVRPPLSSPRSL